MLMVSIDNDGGGVRITPSECCGVWGKRIKSWSITADQWREIARLAEEAAEDRESPPMTDLIPEAGRP
jgi:hypothetical protein